MYGQRNSREPAGRSTGRSAARRRRGPCARTATSAGRAAAPRNRPSAGTPAAARRPGSPASSSRASRACIVSVICEQHTASRPGRARRARTRRETRAPRRRRADRRPAFRRLARSSSRCVSRPDLRVAVADQPEEQPLEVSLRAPIPASRARREPVGVRQRRDEDLPDVLLPRGQRADELVGNVVRTVSEQNADPDPLRERCGRADDVEVIAGRPVVQQPRQRSPRRRRRAPGASAGRTPAEVTAVSTGVRPRSSRRALRRRAPDRPRRPGAGSSGSAAPPSRGRAGCRPDRSADTSDTRPSFSSTTSAWRAQRSEKAELVGSKRERVADVETRRRRHDSTVESPSPACGPPRSLDRHSRLSIRADDRGESRSSAQSYPAEIVVWTAHRTSELPPSSRGFRRYDASDRALGCFRMRPATRAFARRRESSCSSPTRTSTRTVRRWRRSWPRGNNMVAQSSQR